MSQVVGDVDELRRALAEYVAEHTRTLAVAELDPQGRVLSANEPLQRLGGRDLSGLLMSELVAPAQRQTLGRAMSEVRDGWRELLLGLFPDERGVPLDFALSLRRLRQGWLLVAEPAQETVVAVNERLVSLNDELASAQRRIAQQRDELSRQNHRLVELDQLKDALLANVSHDLRTPLTAILGYAELMRRRGGLPRAQERAAEIIERNARRLLRLVEDLLLLAQARAGGLVLDVNLVDLAALARESLELAQPLAAEAQVDVALQAPADGVAMIPADRLRLGQLLDNLLGNAVKFTPAGGLVILGVEPGDASVQLYVQDSGPGIPPAEQKRLFEPFQRGAGVDAPGTGLGLAIVREVTAAHGLSLELDSGAGGTRFSIIFPRPPEGGNPEAGTSPGCSGR